MVRVVIVEGLPEEVAEVLPKILNGHHVQPVPTLVPAPGKTEAPLQPKVISSIISPALVTPREREIARLIYEGLSTPKIAAYLVVEINTIKTHRRSLCRKLGGTTKAILIAHRAAWDKP